jgi:hypothetical protein
MIIQVTNFGPFSGPWGITVRALLGEGGQTVEGTATTDVAWSEESWKLLVRDAVIAAAMAQQSASVDEVVFMDCTSVKATDQGVSSIEIKSNAQPVRTIGTSFQPSVVTDVDATYSVRMTCAKGVLEGNQSIRVKLLSDEVDPPTTERGIIEHSIEGLGGIAMTQRSGQQLHYVVPRAHYVLLEEEIVAGSPTSVVIKSNEQRR